MADYQGPDGGREAACDSHSETDELPGEALVPGVIAELQGEGVVLDSQLDSDLSRKLIPLLFAYCCAMARRHEGK